MHWGPKYDHGHSQSPLGDDKGCTGHTLEPGNLMECPAVTSFYLCGLDKLVNLSDPPYTAP